MQEAIEAVATLRAKRLDARNNRLLGICPGAKGVWRRRLRGHPEPGGVGTTTLYGPAPQTSYDSARPDERQFSLLETTEDASSIDARLERERRFDPDIWVIEIESNSPVQDLIVLTKL